MADHPQKTLWPALSGRRGTPDHRGTALGYWPPTSRFLVVRKSEESAFFWQAEPRIDSRFLDG